MVTGAVFFLAVAATLGVAVYGLLRWPWTRRAGVGGAALRKSTAATLAIGMALVVLAAIYAATLSGFHALVIENGTVRLDYAVPARSVVLSRGDIRQVDVRPAYRSQWQLDITTSTGRFSSALGAGDTIRQAAEALAP
jgi:hypothetical protein